MRISIRIFFLRIIVIVIIGFLGFSPNGKESLNDFKKEAEFLIEKNEYEKTNALISLC